MQLKLLLRRITNKALILILAPIFFLLNSVVSSFVGLLSKKIVDSPKLVWGEAPIINNVYWSNAMTLCGYKSETFTDDYCSAINKREEFGKVLQDRYWRLPISLKYYLGFIESLFRYDIFFISCNGFFLGKTPIWFMEAFFLKIASKKIVVIPFGLDAYIYHRVRSTSLLHGLLASIPHASKKQKIISQKVDYWCSNANCLIPGFMGPDGFGRWDVITPCPLGLDLRNWRMSSKKNRFNDGIDGEVSITHAPNHRGFKGSEFVIDAVKILRNEGLKIKLNLLEGIQNSEVKKILSEETDILIEQLIFTGHGLNGLEGLASGLCVISNLEDENYLTPMRRWSFFDECPIVSASPETITEVLRRLVCNPVLRTELGDAGRRYAEKYHDLDSVGYLFNNVIDYVYKRKNNLIDLYHPILSPYNNRTTKIPNPLKYNKLK